MCKWNLTRLGEALGELMGSGDDAENLFARKDFLDGTIQDSEVESILINAEEVINQCAEEYKSVFMKSYKDSMSLRMGFTISDEADFELVSDALSLMETLELDFHHFFYRLSDHSFNAASILQDTSYSSGGSQTDSALEQVDAFLTRYQQRISRDSTEAQETRVKRMKAANPAFILRSWILDEVITEVEKKGNTQALKDVLRMSSDPFTLPDTVDGKRFCGAVPKGTISGANTQCSCSS